KTWTGARIVVDLIRRGRRVGVAATSHKAIHNLLDEIGKAAREEGVPVRGLKKCSAGNAETEYGGDWIANVDDTEELIDRARRVQLLAGTSWLFAHAGVDGGALVDTVVADEAGAGCLAGPPTPAPAPSDLIRTGNVAAAPEEADRVAREIRAMMGGSWTNRKGETRALSQNDFMVVAPYNMQVRLLRRTLQTAGLGDVPVGTVDKFQGREAPVV